MGIKPSVIGAFTALLLSTVPPAHAQTSDEALAESLFQEARALLEQERYAEACAKLQASQDLDPQNGTLLNLGKCLEKEGRIASAWAAYVELQRLAARARQPAREKFAQERIAALEPDLSYVTLEVTDPVPGLRIQVDGKDIPLAALSSPLPLDPGERRVKASAPKHEPWTSTIELAKATRETLVVPRLSPVSPPRKEQPVAAPPPPLPPPIVRPPALPPPPPPAPDAGLSTPWVISYVGWGFAGAGLLVGGITGGLALSRGGDLNCPNDLCPPEQEDALSEATTLANVSNAAFAVAAGGAVVGLVGLLIGLGETEEDVALTADGLAIRF